MSPSVLRRSGPDFIRDGERITPRALVSTCETCGAPAPFGKRQGDRLLTYCGFHNGEPACVGKASAPSRQFELLDAGAVA